MNCLFEILKLLKKFEVVVKKIHVNYKLCSKISSIIYCLGQKEGNFSIGCGAQLAYQIATKNCWMKIALVFRPGLFKVI
jgi:hypothetical protein